MKSDITEQERQRAWELYALSYDRVLPKLPFYEEVVERHVEAMTESGIHNIIDIGAGTGNVTVELLAKNRQVTAVDLNAAMLARLREKIIESYEANIAIIEDTAEDLSQFADGYFDGVNILLVLYDVVNPSRALSEAIRVLRPGGSIILTEIKKSFQLQPLIDFVNTFLQQQNLYDTLWKDWERVQNANQLLDPGKRHSRLPVEEIEDRLRDHGFVIRMTKDSHLGNCATVWATKSNKT